jgi:hypothetical protein
MTTPNAHLEVFKQDMRIREKRKTIAQWNMKYITNR